MDQQSRMKASTLSFLAVAYSCFEGVVSGAKESTCKPLGPLRVFNWNPEPDGSPGQGQARYFDKCGRQIVSTVAVNNVAKGEIVYMQRPKRDNPNNEWEDEMLVFNIEMKSPVPIKDWGCFLNPHSPHGYDTTGGDLYFYDDGEDGEPVGTNGTPCTGYSTASNGEWKEWTGTYVNGECVRKTWNEGPNGSPTEGRPATGADPVEGTPCNGSSIEDGKWVKWKGTDNGDGFCVREEGTECSSGGRDMNGEWKEWNGTTVGGKCVRSDGPNLQEGDTCILPDWGLGVYTRGVCKPEVSGEFLDSAIGGKKLIKK